MKLEDIEAAGMSGSPIVIWKQVGNDIKRVVVDWIPIKSLKPVEPTITDEQMKQYHSANSICQTLRDIYWLAHERGECEDIKYRCRVAATMADKMYKKLFEYKANWLLECPDQCHLTQESMHDWNARISKLTGGLVWAGKAPIDVQERVDQEIEDGTAQLLDIHERDLESLSAKAHTLQTHAAEGVRYAHEEGERDED